MESHLHLAVLSKSDLKTTKVDPNKIDPDTFKKGEKIKVNQLPNGYFDDCNDLKKLNK